MTASTEPPAEHRRPGARVGDEWRVWGPYLSERQWGTVREDYSAEGTAWEYFPHDHARSRAYRWGEDGLLGFCDREATLCFALALWNEHDAILKERLFGLTGHEGNHGEDVKEIYFHLDNLPDHAYMKALYRYPQAAFPYDDLCAESARRSRDDPEYELIDTGVLAENRFFDVTVEYAKTASDDILIRVSALNCGPDSAPIHLLPTLWFRNEWIWGREPARPEIALDKDGRTVRAWHHRLGEHWLAREQPGDWLFTDNETNTARLYDTPNESRYVKDGIGRAIIDKATDAVNPAGTGTKCAAHHALTIPPGETATVRLRFSRGRHDQPFADADAVFTDRIAEADRFHAELRGNLSDDDALIQRQALAGLLWTKQAYHYDIPQWLEGDPGQPPPPPERWTGRNHNWLHLNNGDVLSVPDSWEYPWFAAWDLGFHCVALALIDPAFAKEQLLLMLREWYMHPSGQLPAYEWEFSDVNPPVHAWAAWRVYKIERRITGKGDRAFLQRVFQKLLLNFTWWVNRKDRDGRNVFQGGFLGLDNIGVFDRSKELPTGGNLEQSDATAWMAMFALNMLAIALELAREDVAYEDMATKFLEHFLYIAGAINGVGLTRGESISLWDETDGFFYDVLRLPDGRAEPLKIRSMVGLMPLLAVETIEPALSQALPDFSRRMRWFLRYRPDLASLVPTLNEPGVGRRRLLSLTPGDRLTRLLRRVLDPDEFLSDYGVRSLSKAHLADPYLFHADGFWSQVRYDPAESTTGLFGGNSNWRGPIWFPINFLLIEALERFHHYYGDGFTVEHPTGSGRQQTLLAIAADLSNRLIDLFRQGPDGQRPIYAGNGVRADDPHWRNRLLFYEYFHGDTGRGLGASHQTGWTALVAKLLDSASRAPADSDGIALG